MQALKLQQVVTAFVLAATSASVSGTSVSVTADFTKLTMGGFSNALTASHNGLSANGVSIDICGGDPDCTDALNDPASITANLSGNSVTFEYDPILLPPSLFPNNYFNVISFTGNTSDVVGVGLSNQFTLGRITFVNGLFYPLMFLDFTLTTHSSNSALNDQSFSGRIRVDSNIGNTPESQADFFTIQDLTGNTLAFLGSVRVYEYNFCPADNPTAPGCNMGSIDIIGHIGSLHLDSFANPTGGAFINSSTTPDLASVPEPELTWLFGSGLLGSFLASKRRRKT